MRQPASIFPSSYTAPPQLKTENLKTLARGGKKKNPAPKAKLACNKAHLEIRHQPECSASTMQASPNPPRLPCSPIREGTNLIEHEAGRPPCNLPWVVKWLIRRHFLDRKVCCRLWNVQFCSAAWLRCTSGGVASVRHFFVDFLYLTFTIRPTSRICIASSRRCSAGVRLSWLQ